MEIPLLTIHRYGAQYFGTMDRIGDFKVALDGDDLVYYTLQSDGMDWIEVFRLENGGGIKAQKSFFTPEGGFATRLINKTGADSVKGSLVSVSTAVDNAFILQSNEYDTMGLVYEDGIADGSDCWVVTSGRAQYLLKDGVAAARGEILIAADTDGRADRVVNPGAGLPGTDIHFKEVGHCSETVSAGTDVLVWGVVHFN